MFVFSPWFLPVNLLATLSPLQLLRSHLDTQKMGQLTNQEDFSGETAMHTLEGLGLENEELQAALHSALARAGANRRQLAVLLGRVLRRLEKVSPAFHLVVHTAPSTLSKKGELAGYWKTLADDFHWHIEILPIVEKRSKSYSIKETYFNAVLPEQAAEHLRSIDPNS